MKRAAVVTLLPTYHGGQNAEEFAKTFDPARDCYADSNIVRQLARDSGRWWSFHSVPTTAALESNRYAKTLTGFTSHATEADFYEMLRESAECGVPRPGGYADVFHHRFHSPRINWSINSALAPAFAGGWQEAIRPGRHAGVWRKYDLRSAYLWAVTQGLPDPRSYTRSISPWTCKHPGAVYRVKLQEPTLGAPFPFNRAVECLATAEEIETYGLRIERIVSGVAWKRVCDTSELVKAIRGVTYWKEAARSYWGRWAQQERIMCVAHGKKWRLPNLALNIPWAHLIVSRVRMRLWEASRGAAHVFVDSVITQREIPTGDGLGDWRLEKVYKHGVLIRAPGQYGGADAEQLDRMAGVGRTSPLRATA